MPSYTSSQRAAITQFVNFTQAKESIAARLLKSHDWDVERAVNAHFSGSTNSGPSQVQQNLRKLFDKYRDSPTDEPNKIEIGGLVNYFEAIGVELDDVLSAAVLELLDAPGTELTRDGFVNGWQNASSSSNSCDTEKSQKQYTQTLRSRLASDPSYFRQVYKAAFKYAKPEDKRAIPTEIAFAYWEMFFGGGKGGINWNTSATKWYDLWKEYYEDKNKRPVNKDLWNQVAELVSKTREEGGETLEWWTEDGAWPTAVDDFVAFVKERRGEDGGMDTT